MRVSIASIALIRREDRGRAQWLARWNERWGCFNFVGGHKRDGESFHECVAREVGEELQLQEHRDFTAAREPTAHLEYNDWSESAGEETAYTIELFEVHLSRIAIRHIIPPDAANRWLTTGEIREGSTRYGQPVSRTMKRVLESIGAILGGPDKEGPRTKPC